MILKYFNVHKNIFNAHDLTSSLVSNYTKTLFPSSHVFKLKVKLNRHFNVKFDYPLGGRLSSTAQKPWFPLISIPQNRPKGKISKQRHSIQIYKLLMKF